MLELATDRRILWIWWVDVLSTRSHLTISHIISPSISDIICPLGQTNGEGRPSPGSSFLPQPPSQRHPLPHPDAAFLINPLIHAKWHFILTHHSSLIRQTATWSLPDRANAARVLAEYHLSTSWACVEYNPSASRVQTDCYPSRSQVEAIEAGQGKGKSSGWVQGENGTMLHTQTEQNITGWTQVPKRVVIEVHLKGIYKQRLVQSEYNICRRVQYIWASTIYVGACFV